MVQTVKHVETCELTESLGAAVMVVEGVKTCRSCAHPFLLVDIMLQPLLVERNRHKYDDFFELVGNGKILDNAAHVWSEEQ